MNVLQNQVPFFISVLAAVRLLVTKAIAMKPSRHRRRHACRIIINIEFGLVYYIVVYINVCVIDTAAIVASQSIASYLAYFCYSTNYYPVTFCSHSPSADYAANLKNWCVELLCKHDRQDGANEDWLVVRTVTLSSAPTADNASRSGHAP